MRRQSFRLLWPIRHGDQVLTDGEAKALSMADQVAIDSDRRVQRNPMWRTALAFMASVTRLGHLEGPVPWDVLRQLSLPDTFQLLAITSELSGTSMLRLTLRCETCGQVNHLSAADFARAAMSGPVAETVAFSLEDGVEINGQVRRQGQVRALELGDLVELDDDRRVQDQPGLRPLILMQRCIVEFDGAPIPVSAEVLRPMWVGDARRIFDALLEASGGGQTTEIRCDRCGAVIATPLEEFVTPFFMGVIRR